MNDPTKYRKGYSWRVTCHDRDGVELSDAPFTVFAKGIAYAVVTALQHGVPPGSVLFHVWINEPVTAAMIAADPERTYEEWIAVDMGQQ